jgi:hypothetical protein
MCANIFGQNPAGSCNIHILLVPTKMSRSIAFICTERIKFQSGDSLIGHPAAVCTEEPMQVPWDPWNTCRSHGTQSGGRVECPLLAGLQPVCSAVKGLEASSSLWCSKSLTTVYIATITAHKLVLLRDTYNVTHQGEATPVSAV